MVAKENKKGKIKIQEMLQKRWEECISDGLLISGTIKREESRQKKLKCLFFKGKVGKGNEVRTKSVTLPNQIYLYPRSP